MKRDEREEEEEIEPSPGPRRKARLEEEAKTLMSLPKEIREMIMLKLDPIDMYALYSGVDNYDFKKWCDDYFWGRAFSRVFPAFVQQPHMRHPRWTFFAATLAKEHVTGKKGALRFFIGANPVDTILVTKGVDMDDTEILFQRQRVDIGRLLFDHFVRIRNEVPTIVDDMGFRRMKFPFSVKPLAELLYHIFAAGYKYRVNLSNRRSFFLGCHICGSATITGYSADDPTKLLCGPACK